MSYWVAAESNHVVSLANRAEKFTAPIILGKTVGSPHISYVMLLSKRCEDKHYQEMNLLFLNIG